MPRSGGLLRADLDDAMSVSLDHRARELGLGTGYAIVTLMRRTLIITWAPVLGALQPDRAASGVGEPPML